MDLTDREEADILRLMMASDELLLEELFNYVQDYLIRERSTWVQRNFVSVFHSAFKLENCKKLQDYCFEIICEDLLQQEPQDVNIVPPPYLDGMTDVRRVEYYYSLIKKAQRRKDRLKALTYAFYLGKMIKIDNNIRKIAKRKLTTYYFQTAICIFYIFEVISVLINF